MHILKVLLLLIILLLSSSVYAKKIDSIQIWHNTYHVTSPRIVSHRGFYNYPQAAQNSRASLRNAIKLGVEGSEMDVWLTIDDKLIVNHDAKREGLIIEKSTLKEVKKLRLSNGEKLPQFKDFLKILKTSKYTHLFVEIKKHSTKARTIEAALKAMNAVNKAGLKGMAEYLSFSLPACVALAKADPTAFVYYLGGDKSPHELHSLGISSMNSSIAVYRQHPTWIKEAHELGMTVTARGMNKRELIREMITAGADNLATDWPIQAMDEREKICKKR